MRRDEQSTDVMPRLPSIQFAAVELHVVEGPDRGARLEVPLGTTRIGSGQCCKLKLTDPTVSRMHCELQVEPDGVRVIDCASTNGTFVDGVMVVEVKLSSGAILSVGRTRIRVEIGQEPVTMTLSPRERFGDVIGASAAMRRVYALMERVASTDATVLLFGETGTGKELVARAIHDASKRAQGPFVTVDCGAIAENLVESELFGHVRGAFTGATIDRAGLFEQARGGTLFLDEIGELPLALQPKLLRALEAREIRAVGSNAARKVDVRVIAATNRRLASSVNDGTFREDLYYRLAVCEIELPPLRARREDIDGLANHFYARISDAMEPLSKSFLASLAARAWPGNVRELKNFIERSATFGWSVAHSPSGTAQSSQPVPVLETLVRTELPLKDARLTWNEQFETLYVAALLRRTGGNVTRAAAIAGVSRRYLHRLIAERGIRGARDDGTD